ncbi:hypothetical protein C2G38_2198430 [Gigaspora rosea]|uniref:Uncharacterized protein n=1 Tax=Gigaspora rosea TaxID=44941 RepID=A0A397UWW5_9GLOM|nr:hypothetical protein C2G38_2198430 [Gigaspora rosea]
MYKAYTNGTLNEVIKDKTSGVDYENDENDFFDDFNSLSQNNEISDSHAIATAASTIAEFNTIDIHDDDIENDLRDARLELAFLLSDASSSNNHDLEIHEKFYTGITEAGALDILYLVNLRKNHKCYSNQNMESKTTYRIQNLDHTNSVSSNMISSLIADCTSNIDTSRTEKLRGIRWKNQCHLSILSNTNKKLDLNGITVANIGEHNPLCKHGYGFAYINHELCLVQIVALYQKNSNYHSYVCGDVFSIDSLSYLSVKVFLPLQNNIFSPISNSGHMIFSHISTKFFIYFLGFGDFIHIYKQHNLITIFGRALELYRFFNKSSTKNLLRIIVNSEVEED